MRFRVLDLYRFFAAVLVMAYHYVTSFNGLFHGASPYVDFFFMLSGFVIMRGYAKRMSTWADYSAFTFARFARLYPLHFATTSFWLALVALVGLGVAHPEHPVHFDAREVIQNYLLIHAWGTTNDLTLNGQSWSISAEWAVYLLFPLFIAVYQRLGARALLGLAIAAVAGLELASGFWLQNARPWLEWTYDFGALRAVPSFLIGMWLSTCARRGASSEGPGIKTGFALFALSIPLAYLDVPRLIVLVDLAAALYFTACGELREQRSWLADIRLVRFGDASYAIYMLHMITMPIAASALRPLLHDAWPTAPIIMVATIVAGLVSYSMFERPAQKWILALRTPRGEHPAIPWFAPLRLSSGRVNALAWTSPIGDASSEGGVADVAVGKAAVAGVKHAA